MTTKEFTIWLLQEFWPIWLVGVIGTSLVLFDIIRVTLRSFRAAPAHFEKHLASIYQRISRAITKKQKDQTQNVPQTSETI
jgi:hypothetical protein